MATGDVEDAPALDPLHKFPIFERDGAVYIMGDEDTIKASRRSGAVKCSVETDEKVVIVGGSVDYLAYSSSNAYWLTWKQLKVEVVL